jgi:hypothetical protein
MIKFWQRIIAGAEVVGGSVALIAIIFAAKAGAGKAAIVVGAGLDLFVIAAGVALWLRPRMGIGLLEVALGLQAVQVFSAWFVWQYVAGVALMVQVVGGEVGWSGGLLVRHSFSAGNGGSGAGVGVNLIAVAALIYLVVSQRREKPSGRPSSA